MKILLDENIDVRFKLLFPVGNYEVYTVRDMQWNGIKNGALLKLLQEHNFDYWIVVDKSLPYQQNTSTLPCIVVVLDVFRNTLKNISGLFPILLTRLSEKTEEKIIVIPEL